MYVVVARCEIHLPNVQSLKGKRAILNRLKDKLRGKGRATVAEVEHMELWQRSTLGMAVVSGEATHADQLMDSLRRVFDGDPEIAVLDWEINRY